MIAALARLVPLELNAALAAAGVLVAAWLLRPAGLGERELHQLAAVRGETGEGG